MWSKRLGLLALMAQLGAGFAFAQSPAAAPAFEVASVKPVDPRPANFRGQMSVDGARVDIRRMSMAELIRTAYQVKAYRVSGPDWIATTRFDIVAKIPEGAAEEQVPAMLKALLADRFQLKVHRENREYPVYALIVAKNGPKLKEAAPDPAHATDPPIPKTNGYGNDMLHMEFSSITMPALVEVLERYRYADRPLVDETGLKGFYQVELDISQLELRMRDGLVLPPGVEPAEPGSLFAAFQHLGLKLEPKKEPVDTIVVDRVEKAPTEN